MPALTTLADVIARLELTAEEELELAALTIRAFDARGTPAMRDAAENIICWWEHRPVSWLERREAELIERGRRIERHVQLMRDTAPDPARDFDGAEPRLVDEAA